MPKKKKPRKKAMRSLRQPTAKQKPPPQPRIEDVTAGMLMERTGSWPEKLLIEVGAAIHKGRTTEPNEAGATYDDCVGIGYAPLDVESCGYRVVATPRRIGVREVAAYAASSCKRCYGLGYWAVQRRVPTGHDEVGRKVMQDIAYEQSCQCADRRFKEQHPTMLVDSQLGEWIALDGLQITELTATAEAS